MADNDELVEQFSVITGVDREGAKKYLDSAAWNLQNAVTIFFEEEERGHNSLQDCNAQDGKSEGSSTDPIPGNMNLGTLMDVMSTLPQTGAEERSKTNQGRLGTIAGIKRNDEGSSDEEGEAFYAGGSESSGQQILDPSRGRRSPNSFVSSLFQSAREHGAEEITPSMQAGGSQGLAFHGTGYRLGVPQGPLEAVPGTSEQNDTPQVDITLKMWKKGFSIDSGDLRLYHDKRNQQFLDSIRMGRVPEELLHIARGQLVNLIMEDHRAEEFVKAKPKAFCGTGHMLGSPAPTVSRCVPHQGIGPAATQPPKALIDTVTPVTTVQIRLSNGQRLMAKFNTSHTIRDLRNFIVISHPEYASTPFILMTTFPNNELTDEKLTLEEARLCNAVIVQHLLEH